MESYTWPNSTGFWTCGGQHYYARATTKEEYEVQDCRNYDCAMYVTQTEFYREKGGNTSLWYPLTLTSHNVAENLLIKVCEHIEAWPVSHAKYIINEEAGVIRVQGLKEWWAKHKPKSEREKKLEKIVCALSLDGTMFPDLIPVAERVLRALEE